MDKYLLLGHHDEFLELKIWLIDLIDSNHRLELNSFWLSIKFSHLNYRFC